jgi:predicted lipid-binding transport protein (Tim44 family)
MPLTHEGDRHTLRTMTHPNWYSGLDAERPKAEDVFFSGKAREVKTLTHILALMARIGDQACLDVYVTTRKQAVSTMMQVVAASVVVTVPTAAHSEKQIHECASLPVTTEHAGHVPCMYAIR